MPPRKQSQIAEREAEILRVAGDILAAEGLHALTMDNVLARVTFSKGTLYNHFTCREDLIVAFYTKCFGDHVEFFERGALFRGRARERFLAAGLGHEVRSLLDPQPFRLALTEDMLQAASSRWRDAFLNMHRDTMGIFVGIARDGIAAGDLPESVTPEFVASAAWALSFGAEDLHGNQLIYRNLPQEEFAPIRGRMMARLLDGCGWKPLSHEHDYDETRRRVLREVYGPEARTLGLLPAADDAAAGS